LRQALSAAERFVLQNHIIWVKSVAIAGRTHGHFKPINSKRYLNHTWEHLLHLTKAGETPVDRLAVGVPFQDKSNIRRFGHEEDLRCAGNVWFVPYDTIQDRQRERGSHPATFPVELARRCLRLHGAGEGALVLDPFLGTGTTLVAARALGITGVGIESDASYAESARRRLETGSG
jgi:site-specific DNA-methyltransferase (adenine-specific)